MVDWRAAGLMCFYPKISRIGFSDFPFFFFFNKHRIESNSKTI